MHIYTYVPTQVVILHRHVSVTSVTINRVCLITIQADSHIACRAPAPLRLCHVLREKSAW